MLNDSTLARLNKTRRRIELFTFLLRKLKVQLAELIIECGVEYYGSPGDQVIVCDGGRIGTIKSFEYFPWSSTPAAVVVCGKEEVLVDNPHKIARVAK